VGWGEGGHFLEVLGRVCCGGFDMRERRAVVGENSLCVCEVYVDEVIVDA
jgi:hypothetical protein